MVRRASGLLALLLACGGGQPGPAAPTAPETGLRTIVTSDGDRLPSGWDARTMVPREVDARDRPPDAVVSARVLMWQVKEDDRPLYVEKAIVWAVVRDSSTKSHWLLLHVYRHPREQFTQTDDWRLSIVADSPIIAVQRFDAAPTNADVIVFLDASGWGEGTTGFRVTGSGTCRHAWQLSMGTPPDQTR